MTPSQQERWDKHLKSKKKQKKVNPKTKKKVFKPKYSTVIPDVKERVNKLRLQQIEYNSTLERKFRKLLDQNEIIHIWQKVFYTDYRYVCVDFYIPEKKIIVELDGQHHDCKDRRLKDKHRTNWIMRNFDIKEVIRIHYMDLKDNQVEDLVLDKLD